MKLEFDLATRQRVQFINIDHLVRDAVDQKQIRNAVCHVFVPHTTAGVTINENADPDVPRDMEKAVNKIVPFEDDYAHAEGNSAAHVKSSFFGASQHLLVRDGRPELGRWQSLFFCEFDGPRSRKVWIWFSPVLD